MSITLNMTSTTTTKRGVRRWALVGALVLTMSLVHLPVASASNVAAASFTGGVNTVVVGGTLYAKNGGALTLSVTTSNDTRCVEVTGAFNAKQTSATAKTSWTFNATAGAGNGVQSVTITARPNFNANNCTGQPGTLQASYVLDNAGPIVTGSPSPAPNGGGWNREPVTITWSAADAGSGIASGPTPASEVVATETAGVVRTAGATDRLGNSGSGSATIKLDSIAPAISGSRTPATNGYGWNNTAVTVGFTCSDGLSGVKSCSGSTTITGNGASQTVTGTAVDNADNSSSASVGGIRIDTVAPQLSGSPTSGPNEHGWYRVPVTIRWACSDSLSGIDGACPADGLISGEGTSQTSSAMISDRAGNATIATSSPAVKVDLTPPVTTATAPAGWNNTDVTVSLVANDVLSGVEATYYAIDGGLPQAGTTAVVTDEGNHTLGFWSVDAAGNEEVHRTVQVKIDETSPTITHSLSPEANDDGWNDSDVTVTFLCDDALSGIASCTEPTTVATEGANQPLTGTATDNAGNSANDPATASIDVTPPSIVGGPDRAPNGSGWYSATVIVTFSCSDELSGIKHCPAPESLHEGPNGSASGTARDAAGNEATAVVSDVDIDETAPSLSGSATVAPNANGWYHDDVTIAWSCHDALSGIDGRCPDDAVVTGEGDDLSTSASVSDLAGNTRDRIISGIRIDRTAPSTLASMPDPLESGWYAGSVDVTLTTGADLSGAETTYFRVDGGATQTYTAPFEHDSVGVHTITFWSVDAAGNVEDADSPGHSITLRIDGFAPTIDGSRLPVANSFGWNNGAVVVNFECADAESGVAACSPPSTLVNEGAGQSVSGMAVDNAGNTASTTVGDINIDLTSPMLTGTATTPPNAFGWYRGDVTVEWAGQDALSSIDASTLPASSVVTEEGDDLVAGPVSVFDRAGNEGTGSVTGLRIDRTDPTISGGTVDGDLAPRLPNAAGWFNSAVRVHFRCADALSGVQECEADHVLVGDGADQSVEGTATDEADNAAATTVGGINVDSRAPTTVAGLACGGQNGYCNTSASVGLAATDQPGLSGVREIRYRVNAGAWQVATGDSVRVPVQLNGSGEATVRFSAVDHAGNEEAAGGVDIEYDTIAPSVTHSLSPEANAAGWNRSNVTVHFDAIDDTGGSGLDVSTVTPDRTIADETPGIDVFGQAYDYAGNRGSDGVTVRLDETAPSISGGATTSPNGNGWYDGPVTIRFTCDDALSGIAACPADVILSTDGANQGVSRTAIDVAGNAADSTVRNINIDTIDPQITVAGIGAGGVYTLGAVPNASCSATDGGSGLHGSCGLSISGGLPNGVGTFVFTATATDQAGNRTVVTGSYRVVYRFDGYLQPINDTAHQVGATLSVFKAGSTVPAKFRLQTANGTVVQANTVPVWLAPAQGTSMTAPIDESVYSSVPTSGGSYRWDQTGQQYIYNWGTSKSQASRYWRMGVLLDDGNTYVVNIGLR